MAQAESERELRERPKKEEVREPKEELGVRRDFHMFQQGVTLTPLQKETKRKRLEREEEERKARELKEELEVRCDPRFRRTSF